MNKAGDIVGNVTPYLKNITKEQSPRPCPRCGGSASTITYSPPGKEPIPGDICDDFSCVLAQRDEECLRDIEEDRRASRVKNLLKRSKLVKRYQSFTLDSFDPGRSRYAANGKEIAEDYLDNWEEERKAGQGIYLTGGVGTGKTHLAVGVTLALMARGVPCLFVTTPDLLESMRRDVSAEESEGMFDAALEADVLVLDDLGAERLTGWSLEKMFTLINHRFCASLPTIYTTNVGPGGMKERLGEPVLSRVLKASTLIHMAGEDQRLKGLGDL